MKAAVILAGLAFDCRHPLWYPHDLTDHEAVRKLRIVDTACGSGM